ncbi:cytochrome c biogenesis protein ResB [Corynebacterium bovis]|uniref:Cytochrome c biogenesis protein ResB n=3 Tax=Corynebacterium bovis TaxID=36808 RepID=A0A3R8PKH5_9CORY|nr:cytochrome c biogenesis protein ResB [Corynebacterium bovis]MBB3116620.1 cytochrome c biogenesis protein [Corynebacterium bovis DSM 20582 = CIP 54.80]MDN8579726.1 cytochrome c biogenesis protein ResB [Corynebacterium bovis]QQC47176.1 cytochrome c biogenesis protein ResB [Corynebacterium bovis]RRO81423.1 cytochrome c biogenesis protein ResB [Corynebacterium bovis]RRO83276.1 cytochrome c biogenesis protein ResB [Corynebacterium bovis]
MLRRILAWPKKGWQWLTKMKTALVLLFLLALAAVPGALLPQRSLNRGNVVEYIQANGTTAKIFDKLGLFDVFSSGWFAAIYMLLMISLVGCIIPRTWDHYKALRRNPPAAPRRLGRLPNHVVRTVDISAEQAKDEIRAEFRRWRGGETPADGDRAGQWSYAAEKGYLREFSNLVFHLSLVCLLVTVAVGRMVYYEGQVIVIAGTENSQFCNSAVSNFDSMRSGPLFDGTTLTPYCVNVKDFTADYLPNGQATMFTSNVDWAEGEDALKPTSEWNKKQLRVNHPLEIDGDGIYLQGHGYAPTFTVTWPNGEKRTETIQFRPDDLTNFLSSGALKMDPPAGMYPDLQERRKHQLAIQGLFAPTAEFSGERNSLLSSSYPGLRDPAVAVDVYRGDTGLDSGVSQDIFSLDTSQVHSGALEKIDRVNLREGESTTLDDGTKVSFDGAKEFVNLQVRRDPTVQWVLVSAVVMIVSLVGSLITKRRRFWVRVVPVDDSTTRLEIAGLARTDSAGWGTEFNRIAERLLHLEEEELDEEFDQVDAGWNDWDDDPSGDAEMTELPRRSRTRSDQPGSDGTADADGS